MCRAETIDVYKRQVQNVSVLKQKVRVIVTLDNDEKEVREYMAAELKFRKERKRDHGKQMCIRDSFRQKFKTVYDTQQLKFKRRNVLQKFKMIAGMLPFKHGFVAPVQRSRKNLK